MGFAIIFETYEEDHLGAMNCCHDWALNFIDMIADLAIKYAKRISVFLVLFT